MRSATLFLLFGCVAAAGCAGHDERAESATVPAVRTWRQVVTPADRDRLSDWRTAFTQALAAARTSGNGPAIAGEGALLDPDSAIDGAALPPGNYRCRVVKLGGRSTGMADYVSYPAFACRVAVTAEGATLEKTTGSQRPVGLLYPEDSRRQIFLGSMVLGDETMAMGYGRDPDRNMAGAVERIGPTRWRLLLPRPQFESMMDVVELIPAT